MCAWVAAISSVKNQTGEILFCVVRCWVSLLHNILFNNVWQHHIFYLSVFEFHWILTILIIIIHSSNFTKDFLWHFPFCVLGVALIRRYWKKKSQQLEWKRKPFKTDAHHHTIDKQTHTHAQYYLANWWWMLTWRSCAIFNPFAICRSATLSIFHLLRKWVMLLLNLKQASSRIHAYTMLYMYL